MKPTKAVFLVHWHQREPEPIAVQYNPTEFSLDKQAQLAEIQIPGLDSPLQQYVRGQSEKLTLELFFDTTEHGMGSGATSVTTETDKIYQLIKIEPTRHAPPILTFVWAPDFPGSSIGGAPGATAAAATRVASSAGASAISAVGTVAAGTGAVASSALSGIGAALGGQRRNGFRCVMESIKQKFTLFSSDGVPLRATLNVVLREYKTLEDQLQQLHRSSPDKTHVHVLEATETLASVANRYLDTPALWRKVADHNRIEDPRRLTPGTFLRIEPLR